ncbi:MAG: hypothetical protein MJ239_07650 [Bacilli bacterium]|nr:hypothetical protein [Bacilli bacterium]
MNTFKFLLVSTLAATPFFGQNVIKRQNSVPGVFYIDAEKGNDSNDGSAESPYKTIEKALTNSGDLELHLLGNNEYVAVTSETNLFADGHDNVSIIGEEGVYPKFTITGPGSNKNWGFIGTNLTLNKITYYSVYKNAPDKDNPEKDLTLRYSLYACGNDLTFGDDCKVDNDSFAVSLGTDTGIEYARDFQIFAGTNGKGGTGKKDSSGQYISGPGIVGKLEKNDNTLTFLSGEFGKITLSNRVADTGTETNHFKPKVVVGGNAYVSYVGGANDWFNYIDSDITVTGNARVHRIVGGILGYIYTPSVGEKTYIYSGKSTINIEGGYVKNIIGGSMGRMSAFVKNEADTEINVSGGSVETLIGGSAAGNTYGNIAINVTSGTFGEISDDVKFGISDSRGDLYDTTHDAGFFCGGSGMSSMIHTDSSIANEIYSSLGGCYKENDILGKAGKVMAMGNVYGKINANITGGTFNCNIHGGGKGFDYSTIAPAGKENLLFNVAQVSKGVNLAVAGCTVNGNIYGGGAGIDGEPEDNYSRIALVAGTINLHIGNSTKALTPGSTNPADYATVIYGTVYGGGINPKVTALGSSTPVIAMNIENTYIKNPNKEELPEDQVIAIHGGSENASVDGSVSINIQGSAICNNIYLGSGSGDINGSINIDILDSNVDGDLTLGSVTGDINGDVTVVVEGLSVVEDINIGSDNGTITGKVDVTISSTSVNKDINVGSGDDAFNSDIEVTINKGTTVGGTVNDNTGEADLDLNISDDTEIAGEMVYIKSFVRAHGNYGGTARLLADHKNKPDDVTPVYHWYKVVGSEKQEFYSGTENYIDLTPEQTGSYCCEASYTKGSTTTNVMSNTARFIEKSEVKAAQVGFDSTPIFNLFVELSSDFDPSEEATVRIGNREVSVKGVADTTSLGFKTYKFSLALAPYETAAEVELKIDSESVDDKYSVKQYCKEVLDSEQTSSELKDLVKALLNYGAAAQGYFDYASYNLANSFLDESDKALPTSIGAEYNKLHIENESEDIKAYSATVEILTSTTMRIYFVAQPGGSIDGYKAYINGEEISSDKILEKNGRYYVEIEGIAAKDLNKEYTVKLEKGDSYASVTYSVLTYCYSKQNSSNEALKKFALSLFGYYQAVESYLN